MIEGKQLTTWQKFGHGLAVTVSGIVLTLSCFLVLPLLQAITQPEISSMDIVQEVTTELPPPPPPRQEEEEEKDDAPPPPAPVSSQAPPLNMADMDMILNGGWSGDGSGGALALATGAMFKGVDTSMDQLFDMGDLVEDPNPYFRARPDISRAMEERLPCTVFIEMTVDAQGNVVNPIVVRSDDPMFNEPALRAIRKWKFEPGKRGGKPDVFRVRQQITFE